jgi:membrane-bound lytic murein transglycosylase D
MSGATHVVAAVPVDGEETFSWGVDSDGKATETIELPQPVPVTTSEQSTKLADSVETLQVDVSTDSVTRGIAEPVRINIADLPNKEHVVQPKETLYSIAKIYSIGVMDLVNWNNLDLQQGIKIGQVLKLTDTQNVTEARKIDQEVFHEVKASDTLYSIARQYGVTIKELMDWNAKKDFTLGVGEKLKVFQRQ